MSSVLRLSEISVAGQWAKTIVSYKSFKDEVIFLMCETGIPGPQNSFVRTLQWADSGISVKWGKVAHGCGPILHLPDGQ